jgi:hypothetical protein
MASNQLSARRAHPGTPKVCRIPPQKLPPPPPPPWPAATITIHHVQQWGWYPPYKTADRSFTIPWLPAQGRWYGNGSDAKGSWWADIHLDYSAHTLHYTWSGIYESSDYSAQRYALPMNWGVLTNYHVTAWDYKSPATTYATADFAL